MSQPTRFTLSQKDIPSRWYNLNADFPEPLPPPLHPGTKEPIPPEALEAIFPRNLIEQEISAETWIEIPEPVREIADSDDIGHLFQSISDSVPGLSDSCRSEATLWVSHKGVSDRSQDFATVLVLIRSPAEGRRPSRQPQGVVAPSIRAGGERRGRTPELQFAFPPVATRNGLTRPPE